MVSTNRVSDFPLSHTNFPELDRGTLHQEHGGFPELLSNEWFRRALGTDGNLHTVVDRN